MSEIQACTTAMEGISRPQRRLVRAVGHIRSQAIVRIEAADAATDVAAIKIEDYATANASAMRKAADTALLQRSLEQVAPEAANRLGTLADREVLAFAEVLGQLQREMRRA
ncbi:hypothetical protein [Promicromonospora sp. NFX87]|uniref:hypothetical protein n=1 Tax=Promicromonospora sp. NFX87 TaxID=3402691 RepID=UPI003AFAC67B